jgi:antitoxin component of MazEF toxin-antitoxin module
VQNLCSIIGKKIELGTKKMSHWCQHLPSYFQQDSPVRKRIVQRDGLPVLVLPPKLLEELGLSLGDEVDLQVIDGTLLISPAAGALSDGGLDAAIQELLDHRGDLYAVLGE